MSGLDPKARIATSFSADIPRLLAVFGLKAGDNVTKLSLTVDAADGGNLLVLRVERHLTEEKLQQLLAELEDQSPKQIEALGVSRIL